MRLGNSFNYRVGVIIPVYNRGDLFNATLNSLENQFYKDFLTIVIDDGSTENIKNICEQHKNRINIYYIRNKENLGIAKTRQKGIDFIIEKNIPYFTFIDSDDLLLPHSLEMLLMGIYYSDEDMCVGDRLQVHQDNFKLNGVHSNIENTIWITNKMYKTQFIKNNNIVIKNLSCHEDLYFSLRVLNNLPNIRYLNEVTYIQLNEPTSYTSQIDCFSKDCMEYTYLQAVCQALLDSNNIHPLTMQFLFLCYKDYQLCKLRNIDLTEINELLYQVGNFFQMEEVDDETWFKLISYLTPIAFLDKNFGDYDDIEQIVLFEETFYKWCNKFNLIKTNIFPVKNLDFFRLKKQHDNSEVDMDYARYANDNKI